MFMQQEIQYQPSGGMGTRSPPSTQHRLQNPEWPLEGPKMADGDWEKNIFGPKSFYQKIF